MRKPRRYLHQCEQDLRRLQAAGLGHDALAARLDVAPSTVAVWLRLLGLSTAGPPCPCCGGRLPRGKVRCRRCRRNQCPRCSVPRPRYKLCPCGQRMQPHSSHDHCFRCRQRMERHYVSPNDDGHRGRASKERIRELAALAKAGEPLFGRRSDRD